MTDALRKQASERVGRILQGKWHLDELIGVGGTASVYSATHRNHKRAALKMLHREVSRNAEIRERFLREGYVANKVGHAGAVSVLDDDVSEEGLAFLVMELLEGETLDERWEREESAGHKLEPLEVLRWMDALLDVLTVAHEKGIVHRDLKPENLFLTRQGQLKVLDFGIARAFETVQFEGITKTGLVMGTPAFMAPEQALAHWEDVDERTDLWAVGATMFTLLSGRHVHEGSNGQEVMIKSATERAPSLARVVPGIPVAVAAIVDRAVAFDRAHRWTDAKTMRAAVADAIALLEAGGGAVEAVEAGGGAVDSATHAAARARVVNLETELATARAERASLDHRMTRRVETRGAGVNDAQVALRKALADFGRRALADGQSFGPELAASRAAIDALAKTASDRDGEVRLHEAAIDSFDRAALKKGYAIGGAMAFLVFALLFGPLLYRSYVGVEAPPLHPASTGGR
jgi:tRNA A-37 threonylcarbamoyl transferase component Bud32